MDDDSSSVNTDELENMMDDMEQSYIKFDFYFDRENKLFIIPSVSDIDALEIDDIQKLVQKGSYSYVEDVEEDINYLHQGGNKKIIGGSSTKIRKSFKYNRNLIKKK